MGKKYCKVDQKWCRFLRHGICTKVECKLDSISRCPRLAEIETIRLYDLLKETDFETVFKTLCHWFSDQEKSREGYEFVYNKIKEMKLRKHNLSDLFIKVEAVKEEDEDIRDWLNVCGKDIISKSIINYGLEFEDWNDWISMFITQDTLDTLSKEDIVAACLYEMTFYGFTEEDVQNKHKDLLDTVKAVKESKLLNYYDKQC